MLKLSKKIFLGQKEINFVDNKKIQSLVHDFDVQVLEVISNAKGKQNHLIFSVHIQPHNFYHEYEKKLSKNKKIILFGSGRKNVSYYRFLIRKGYTVFLTEDKQGDEIIKQIYN